VTKKAREAREATEIVQLMLTPLTPSYAHVVFYFHVGMARTSGDDLRRTKLTIGEGKRRGFRSVEPGTRRRTDKGRIG
jgi:hypothetical protein